MSGVGRPTCVVCEETWAEHDKKPPCYKCRPVLKKTNAPFFILYNYCQDQYIMGPDGAIALNGLFIDQAMKDHKIRKRERKEFSLKVRQIANIIISAQHKEAKAKAEAARKK